MSKLFAEEKVSKIKEMLNYGNLDRKSLLKMFNGEAQVDDEREAEEQAR
jgi:hypothetical protein